MTNKEQHETVFLAKLFINKAKIKFGDRFDYSKINYKNKNEDVIIVCPIHGDFLQKPKNHLHSSYPCPKCVPPHNIPKIKPLTKNKRPPKLLPDEMINGRNVWIRYCPQCHKKQSHHSEYNRRQSNNQKLLCLSCRNKGHKCVESMKIKCHEKMKEYWNNKQNGIIITQYFDGKV